MRSLFWSSLTGVTVFASGCFLMPGGPPFQIAYETLFTIPGGIMIMDADGSDRYLLVAPKDGAFCPSFSPDGGRIAYAMSTAGQIAVIDVASGTETQLTSGPERSLCVGWSPDGSRIAFFRGPSNGPLGLYTMKADGSDVRQLATAGFFAGGIDWSPDERWLVVETDSGTLALVDATTGARGPPLLTGPATYDAHWSPDGQQLVYVRQSGAGSDLYVVNADGSGQRRLTHSPDVPPYVNYSPRWSPDGTMIAYCRLDPLTGPNIVVIDADGNERSWKGSWPILGDQPFWRRRP